MSQEPTTRRQRRAEELAIQREKRQAKVTVVVTLSLEAIRVLWDIAKPFLGL